jgi:hypothetical protein
VTFENIKQYNEMIKLFEGLEYKTDTGAKAIISKQKVKNYMIYKVTT